MGDAFEAELTVVFSDTSICSVPPTLPLHSPRALVRTLPNRSSERLSRRPRVRMERDR